VTCRYRNNGFCDLISEMAKTSHRVDPITCHNCGRQPVPQGRNLVTLSAVMLARVRKKLPPIIEVANEIRTILGQPRDGLSEALLKECRDWWDAFHRYPIEVEIWKVIEVEKWYRTMLDVIPNAGCSCKRNWLQVERRFFGGGFNVTMMFVNHRGSLYVQ
jgi:hypothetical protein